jgi:CRISPR-associated endonuclease Csn1
MKKILGLDLGTASIGWALVNEAEKDDEKSSIIKAGVRVNPITVDEQRNFSTGKAITTNADRTLKRSMRRNLQRYKLRRENLIECLKENGWITDQTILAEQGNRTTFQTLQLRAKAATEEVSLEELARILLKINKKRGYKSSRKVNSDEEGQLIDGMAVAKELYERDLTPGQFVHELLCSGKSFIPDFYRSDLESEFDKIWESQRKFYPELLTDELRASLQGRNESQTWAICREPFNIVGIKRTTKGKDLLKENYSWRAKAVSEKLDLEELAIVLQQINGQIKKSSGYLGGIGDRSKALYFNNMTVGQYQWAELKKNPNQSLKNQVFYRQDYLDEFEKIWETQARFHKELTPALKKELRDIVIFYQRPLKSQKGLINLCEFEKRTIETEIDGEKKIKEIGPRACPKSSPIFQEFRIWQVLNNVKVNDAPLNQEQKQMLYNELNIKNGLKKSEVLKLLGVKAKDADLNYDELPGNQTQAMLYEKYSKIVELTGHGEYDFAKMPSAESKQIVSDVFGVLGYNTKILEFDSSLSWEEIEKEDYFKLWHLLYSYEGDNSTSGNEKLIEKISALTNLDREYAKLISEITFETDYGSLSSKAMRKIMPFMKQGYEYSDACAKAGYRHSAKSLTKEELENRTLKDRLDILPKNSLRNPVVEKILNQMVNVVNEIIEEYGKPDEVRIELARELKKNAKERKEMSDSINSANAENEKIKGILNTEFGIASPSRNDILRYRLYLELAPNGYKTIYSNTYVRREEIFSDKFDIEHIIPQAKLFDDSFSNKTLEAKQINIEKSNRTAIDFVKDKYGDAGLEQYVSRVDSLEKQGSISRAKHNKLLMHEADIPSGFIDRDLRDSQYIAKKAKEMLEDVVASVVPTTGSVTDRLREDWQLVDVMQELDWKKYEARGMTETFTDKDGRKIKHIKNWTKRNDQRHHAMDAITIAFTRKSYIQYLNHLNARVPKSNDDSEYIDLRGIRLDDLPKEEVSKVVRYIESTQLYRDSRNKLRFVPPMPLDVFRAEAKKQLENLLVSFKSKNKVATRNVNTTKKRGKSKGKKVQLTPRGQLHNETIYGSIKQYAAKEEKVGSSFDMQKIESVASLKYRKALKERLAEFGNDPKKAFGGSNSLAKKPLYIDEIHSEQVPEKVKTVSLQTIYTIRKSISPDLKIQKVIDPKIRSILQNRLDEFGGDARKAFANLDENPIWLNREKGISIKRVTITGASQVIPLRDKHDMLGKPILNDEGNTVGNDFVQTSNNHHIAIYRDPDGNLQEYVVSFFEAMARKSDGLSIIDKDYKKSEGWKFLFTMKQNEYFVFPNKETGFDPNEIDLLDPKNYSAISPNLYRVQKLASKDYYFRHHLETTVEDVGELKGLTWKRIRDPKALENIVKVRINHLGNIVGVGEY